MEQDIVDQAVATALQDARSIHPQFNEVKSMANHAQPNILFIMADQMTAPALPLYGHPLVKAPALSALASGGVVFENAYCNSPLCAPSRFSMLSGRLPSRIGAYDNAALFPADVPTMAHYLRALNYETILCGKMHFVGPDQLHGFEERLTTDIYPSDYGWTPDWEEFETRPSWYHNMLSVVQAGVCETSNQLDFDEEVAFYANQKLIELAKGEDPRPFFLLVSFTHPHDPYAITAEYWDRYDPREINLPAVSAFSYEDMDPHSKRLYHVCGLGEYSQTDERVRNARRAYYGMISYVDDKIGQLMTTLERVGLGDKTVIVFLSDHGEMLGERGLWYKMSFFEWSARVPLLFKLPGASLGRRIAEPVSLVDLLPTLVDLAAAGRLTPADLPLDGHSLAPMLEEGGLAEGHSVYGEMLGEGAISSVLMIRRGNHKYVFSQPDPEQLYDLSSDPTELRNLAGTQENEQTCQFFRDELAAQWDLQALHDSIVASQRRRRFLARSLRSGRHTAWDFQPFRDASQRFMRNHLDLNVLERTARFPRPLVPPPDGPRARRS